MQRRVVLGYKIPPTFSEASASFSHLRPLENRAHSRLGDILTLFSSNCPQNGSAIEKKLLRTFKPDPKTWFRGPYEEIHALGIQSVQRNNYLFSFPLALFISEWWTFNFICCTLSNVRQKLYKENIVNRKRLSNDTGYFPISGETR